MGLVIAHDAMASSERRAWIDDVLSDERRQDLDLYLSRRLTGSV